MELWYETSLTFLEVCEEGGERSGTMMKTKLKENPLVFLSVQAGKDLF